MKLLIRTDASEQIGTGHVIRCLTVAGRMAARGHQVVFAMRETKGNLIALVREKGFPVLSWPDAEAFDWAHDAQRVAELARDQAFDACLVDHYGIDARWEIRMLRHIPGIAVIDDLANRPHDCQILLDQNLVPDYRSRYDRLVPTGCRKLLGPTFMLLRDEFLRARQTVKARSGRIGRLLVFMGGSDPTGETLKIIEALNGFPVAHVDVITGMANRRREQIHSICRKWGYTFYCQIDFLARLLSEADFACGAGGISLWERLFLGLPSLTTVVADNQREITDLISERGLTLYCGSHETVTADTYTKLLEQAAVKPERIAEMSRQALNFTKSMTNGEALIQQLEKLEAYI